MSRPRLLFGAILALGCAVSAAAGEDACATCLELPRAERDEQPLRIEIESGLQFSRLALAGQEDGAAEIDPRTGAKRVVNMIDLGGISYQARATVRGQPLRPVRVELPARVLLRSPSGAEAELTHFVTDLPPVAMLDENGLLTFNFGARISSRAASGGDFRGRIEIHVDYF
ncbi:DUF4402 domain-containing protein [Altererythrobacter sp. Root672]|uniref:DUF4402 domain-containing protein n=1 Tax=Altererythrobacter sp. Root672 TaxID=1736584 RepID=UPI00138F4A92|nr:DUF4402 domain-containing protein [Altererythrobacter sp. Root672]